MAVSKDSGIATRTSDGDNSNLRQTFVVSFYHALFSGRGTTTHIGNTNTWMFACDWLQIGGDNAAIGGIIAVTWEVFGALWHAMCHLWSAIFFWLMTGLRRRAEIRARKTGPGVECGQMIWWLMRQLEVWRMTHLMVDAFKAGGQPIKPHQLWGEITEMEIKYCLLPPPHIGAATLARVIGWRLCALCQWIAPLDFNQESIREGSQSRITNKSTSNGY